MSLIRLRPRTLLLLLSQYGCVSLWLSLSCSVVGVCAIGVEVEHKADGSESTSSSSISECCGGSKQTESDSQQSEDDVADENPADEEGEDTEKDESKKEKELENEGADSEKSDKPVDAEDSKQKKSTTDECIDDYIDGFVSVDAHYARYRANPKTKCLATLGFLCVILLSAVALFYLVGPDVSSIDFMGEALFGTDFTPNDLYEFGDRTKKYTVNGQIVLSVLVGLTGAAVAKIVSNCWKLARMWCGLAMPMEYLGDPSKQWYERLGYGCCATLGQVAHHAVYIFLLVAAIGFLVASIASGAGVLDFWSVGLYGLAQVLCILVFRAAYRGWRETLAGESGKLCGVQSCPMCLACQSAEAVQSHHNALKEGEKRARQAAMESHTVGRTRDIGNSCEDRFKQTWLYSCYTYVDGCRQRLTCQKRQSQSQGQGNAKNERSAEAAAGKEHEQSTSSMLQKSSGSTLVISPQELEQLQRAQWQECEWWEAIFPTLHEVWNAVDVDDVLMLVEMLFLLLIVLRMHWVRASQRQRANRNQTQNLDMHMDNDVHEMRDCTEGECRESKSKSEQGDKDEENRWLLAEEEEHDAERAHLLRIVERGL